MNKNYFSRMALCITNKCNQRCSWCFEGSWKNEQTKMMSVEDVEKLIRWKNWNTGVLPIIFILGGEPTIHPQLLEILDAISSYNQGITKGLLTNMTCDRGMLKELLDRKVVFFANVDQFEKDNNVKNQPIILENLDYLNSISSNSFSYNISATISHPDKDFTFLYDIVKNGKNKIYNLRLAPSCIGFEFNNQFQKEVANDYYNKTLEVVTKCLEINPNLHLSGECAINGCMVSDDLYKKLKSIGYNLRYKCGDPEPNGDILPDLSSHWCFAFEGVPEMTIKNVFDYPDYDSMIQALSEKHEKFKEKYLPQCNQKSCLNTLCEGPCVALNYYIASKKLPKLNFENEKLL